MRCCHAAGAWWRATSMTCRSCSASASCGSSMGHSARSTPSCRPFSSTPPPSSSCASPTRWHPGSAVQQLALWSAAASRCAFGWPIEQSQGLPGMLPPRVAAAPVHVHSWSFDSVTCTCLKVRLRHSQQVPCGTSGMQMPQQRMCAGHAVPTGADLCVRHACCKGPIRSCCAARSKCCPGGHASHWPVHTSCQLQTILQAVLCCVAVAVHAHTADC